MFPLLMRMLLLLLLLMVVVVLLLLLWWWWLLLLRRWKCKESIARTDSACSAAVGSAAAVGIGIECGMSAPAAIVAVVQIAAVPQSAVPLVIPVVVSVVSVESMVSALALALLPVVGGVALRLEALWVRPRVLRPLQRRTSSAVVLRRETRSIAHRPAVRWVGVRRMGGVRRVRRVRGGPETAVTAAAR